MLSGYPLQYHTIDYSKLTMLNFGKVEKSLVTTSTVCLVYACLYASLHAVTVSLSLHRLQGPSLDAPCQPVVGPPAADTPSPPVH